MLLIALALDLAALIGLCLWRPEPEPKPKPVCLMSPAELWELFAGLDADGSGDLDGDELGALLKALGAVSFTHPLGFLLLVLAASTGVRARLRRGRRTLTAACVAANACAGARLAYHWNAFALVCSVPFFLTAAAVGRLHGAERRSFGAVSLLSILMLRKAAPFLVVAPILVGVWLVEIWNSGYAWFVERWDDVEYWHAVWNWQLPPPAAAARSRGRSALARCAIYFFMGGFWIYPGAMPLVRGHRRLGPEDNLAPRRRRRHGKLPSRAGDGPCGGDDAARPETWRADATTVAA